MFLQILELAAGCIQMVVPKSAGNEHGPVVSILLLVAEYIRYDPEAFDPADGVLHEYPNAALAAILFFESLAQWPAFGLFPRHGHGVAGELLEEGLQLECQRWRRYCFCQDAQASAIFRTLRIHRSLDVGEKSIPLTHPARVGNDLGTIRIVQRQDRGLREGIR